VAQIRKRAAAAKLLREKGAKENLVSSAAGGRLDRVREILNAQPERLHKADVHGMTVLHHAAKGGQKTVVALLLEEGARVNARSQNGFTPLHLAVQVDAPELVKLLVRKGADYDARDRFARTPLMEACYSGHNEIVKLLVTEGADVKAPDKDGWTPLMWAVSGCGGDLVLLRRAGAATVRARKKTTRPISRKALIRRRLDLIQFLVDKGADVKTTDANGGTSLHMVCREMDDMSEIIEKLIALGADVNAKTRRGNTPAAVARQFGRMDVLRQLRKHGAKD